MAVRKTCVVTRLPIEGRQVVRPVLSPRATLGTVGTISPSSVFDGVAALRGLSYETAFSLILTTLSRTTSETVTGL